MTSLATLVDPDLAFRLGNGVALLGWLLLAVATPSRRFAPLAWRIAGGAIPLLLGGGYVVLLVAHWGPGGFGSLAEVRQLCWLSSRCGCSTAGRYRQAPTAAPNV